MSSLDWCSWVVRAGIQEPTRHRLSKVLVVDPVEGNRAVLAAISVSQVSDASMSLLIAMICQVSAPNPHVQDCGCSFVPAVRKGDHLRLQIMSSVLSVPPKACFPDSHSISSESIPQGHRSKQSYRLAHGHCYTAGLAVTRVLRMQRHCQQRQMRRTVDQSVNSDA